MLEIISSEYSLQTCSPVKYVESAAIADDISDFLAKGGQIKQCEQSVVKQRVRKHTAKVSKPQRCMPSLYNVVVITSTQQLVEKHCS